MRGRKGNLDSDGNAAKAQRGAKQGQVVGSRMVERFMNARISNAEESRVKINMNESSKQVSSGNKMVKLNGSLNDNSGFGRLMSKSSLDMALKHMVRINIPFYFLLCIIYKEYISLLEYGFVFILLMNCCLKCRKFNEIRAIIVMEWLILSNQVSRKCWIWI